MWLNYLLIIWGLFPQCLNADNVNPGAILGCSPNNLSPGFKVEYYEYPLTYPGGAPDGGICYNPAYQDDDFLFNGGYKNLGKGMIGTSSGVTDLYFKTTFDTSCTVNNGMMPSNYHFDQTFATTNFTMLITGYLKAPKTGSYNFNLNYVDDLIYVNLGAGNAFQCCQSENTATYPGKFVLEARWSFTPTQQSAKIDLVKDVYYPIRVFYVNRDNLGGLDLSITDADGVEHEDWSGFIFSGGDLTSGEKCDVEPATSTTGWPKPYTSTYTTVSTYSNSKGSLTTGDVIVVETPIPPITQTTTTFWTGTYTTTYSTQSTEFVGSDGLTTPEVIYHVETPEAHGASTTYTPWTGTYTSTYATSQTTVKGSDGVETVSTIYYVETPEAHGASTTYTPWTGTYTSTYATSQTTVKGSDGVETVSTIYYVETPISAYYANTTISTSGATTRTPSWPTVTTTSNGVTSEYTTTCPESDLTTRTPSWPTVTTTSNGVTSEYTTTCPESDLTTRTPSWTTVTTTSNGVTTEYTTTDLFDFKPSGSAITSPQQNTRTLLTSNSENVLSSTSGSSKISTPTELYGSSTTISAVDRPVPSSQNYGFSSATTLESSAFISSYAGAAPTLMMNSFFYFMAALPLAIF
ncbi:AIG_G0006450.mRNA.1.CDS.1 [Saccharomyces cerevisiae]|nr:AIG_G0006450.mRNA.1.CDS.1 [Saccharomyces cerevisiae]CAI6526741.1 AIG_G0006450.mRNA.1.CDS.1 [Saccharomyces cerevisiae]